jgi:hypothetical protein
LLRGHIAVLFFEQVLAEARERGLTSDEHFTVDGTLVEAWAGIKSFKRKDGKDQKPPDGPRNPSVDFHNEKRTNQTHQSSTDPDSRLLRKGKGKEAKLCFIGHVVMENRNGLAVGGRITRATGTTEAKEALGLLEDIPRKGCITVGGDKGFDKPAFIAGLRGQQATPHVARNTTNQSSNIDQRTTRHPGYEVSQRKRKRIEEIFGWLKTIGMMRKTRHRGVLRVGWVFTFALAAYNLIRIRNLVAVPA